MAGEISFGLAFGLQKMWRLTVFGVGAAFFRQFSGINAFVYYAPTLFESIGQGEEMATTLSGVFNCLQLVAVFICFVVIDRVGRRLLCHVWCFWMLHLLHDHRHLVWFVREGLGFSHCCYLSMRSNGLCLHHGLWRVVQSFGLGPTC